jgi:hypothetical protein
MKFFINIIVITFKIYNQIPNNQYVLVMNFV